MNASNLPRSVITVFTDSIVEYDVPSPCKPAPRQLCRKVDMEIIP